MVIGIAVNSQYDIRFPRPEGQKWYNTPMLVDNVTVTIRAGRGGNGASSFSRNRFADKAAPNGGNGGTGGSIYFQGSPNVSDLREFRYKKRVIAEDGSKGMRNNHFGKNAADLAVIVPLGTRITDEDSGEVWEIEDATPILIAAGGKGGVGNFSFRTPQNKLPEYAETGAEGKARKISLELRLIARVGLIGLPNAGKSSLLATLTNAKPAIAAYPFTTLEPNIGMMDKEPIADIPGLIEGASKGKGLGTTFLKHIEKTSLLVHCIDATTADPLKTYDIVRHEFEQFSPVLAEKSEVILITKTDLVNEDTLKKTLSLFKTKKKSVYACSIYDLPSIEKLKKTLKRLLP